MPIDLMQLRAGGPVVSFDEPRLGGRNSRKKAQKAQKTSRQILRPSSRGKTQPRSQIYQPRLLNHCLGAARGGEAAGLGVDEDFGGGGTGDEGFVAFFNLRPTADEQCFLLGIINRPIP